MGARHADRIWMVGGVVGAALLLALGWFLAISPKNAEADALRTQTEETQTRLITLRHRLSELQEQAKQLDSFKATLKANQDALPVDSGLPDFLRQLQTSGDRVGVAVTGVTVNAPEEATAGGATVYALPIVVTADGNATNLGRFLDQLQQVQPRAVLIESTNMTTESDKAADKMTVSLTMKAFVAPGPGQPAPTVAPTASATR
jgi:Tfp pilus assembly protein PilO